MPRRDRPSPLSTAAGVAAGDLIGKGAPEWLNPSVEHAYQKQRYAARPYVRTSATQGDYSLAYQYGWESRGKH